MTTRAFPSLLLGLFVVGLPVTAEASPWTLRQGEIVVASGLDLQVADSEFLDGRGEAQPYPLRGLYRAAGLSLGIRGGFTDRLEFEIQLPIRVVSYTSDPVVLLAQPEGSPLSPLDYFQENVIDLSETRWGLSDLVVATRYQFFGGPIALAGEVRLRSPTGYEGPSGTFGENPTSAEDLATNVERFVRPENVEDDVTLGSGVFSTEANLLFGWAFPTGTFLRADGGYRLRLGGGGDQVTANLKVGQLLGDRFLFFVEGRFEYTVETGRVIGISVAAVDPNVPASEYGGTSNLLLREVTLDRDALDIGAGLLWKVTDEVELYTGYTRTVWGRNTAVVNGGYFGFAVRTDLLTSVGGAPPAAETPAPRPTAPEPTAPAPEIDSQAPAGVLTPRPIPAPALEGSALEQEQAPTGAEEVPMDEGAEGSTSPPIEAVER